MSFLRCPHCSELIYSSSEKCRFCGQALSPEEVAEAMKQHQFADAAIREAMNLKLTGWAATLVLIPQVYVCVWAERVLVRWLVVQILPPIGLGAII